MCKGTFRVAILATAFGVFLMPDHFTRDCATGKLLANPLDKAAIVLSRPKLTPPWTEYVTVRKYITTVKNGKAVKGFTNPFDCKCYRHTDKDGVEWLHITHKAILPFDVGSEITDKDGNVMIVEKAIHADGNTGFEIWCKCKPSPAPKP